jgi:GNAT superfamily N-acetyltransferase
MTTNLSNNFTLRPPTMNDLDAVVELMNICTLSIMGRRNFNAAFVGRGWGDDEFHLDTDAWVVTAPDRSIVGYADFSEGGEDYFDIVTWEHPQYAERGIRETLLMKIEDRARSEKRSGKPITLDHSWVYEQDRSTRESLEKFGYRIDRTFHRMQIEMTEPPSLAKLPDGIQIRSFRLGEEERAVYDAYEEAQADEWGHQWLPFDKWQYYFIQAEENFDPTLWFLAVDGDQIAGYIFARAERPGDPEEGHIRYVAVRRPWRKRGIALALLRQSFAEFYRRGKRKVGLGVDATSLTGADRLYERAGMRVYQSTLIYKKVLEM